MTHRIVDILNEHDALTVDEATIVALFRTLDSWQGAAIPPGSLSVAFLNSGESAQLHQQFFDDPTPTDVMTFPGDPDEDHAGDIAVCPEVALSAMAEYRTTFSAELTLYLVHGWLHLAGFDDQTASQQQLMRSMERQALEFLEANSVLTAFAYDNSKR